MVYILIAIVFSIFCTFYPIKTKNITFNSFIAPLFALNFLFAFRVIDVDVLSSAILGNANIDVWKIILIFFSVAYVSISTDVSGVFDAFAYRLIKKSKYNGKSLFIFFYLFAAVLTIFTSNDIVILVLTPIILYVGKYTRINVLPLLLAQFFAANTFSMLLSISNPTNIIVASAMNIAFNDYIWIMLFPTLVAGILTYFLIYFLFKDSINVKFKLNEVRSFSLTNRKNAYFSIAILLSMFLCLILSQLINTEVWVITTFYLLIAMLKDLICAVYNFFADVKMSKIQDEKNLAINNEPAQSNCFVTAMKRMPWDVIVFVVCFFVFIEGFSSYLFVDTMAIYLGNSIGTLWDGIISFGVMGMVIANLVSNQPMTIFFVNVIFNENIAMTREVMVGSLFGLVVASNLAANITFTGSLAGLMWKDMLKGRGVQISFSDFLKRGLFITPIVFIVTIITLYLVLAF